MKLYEDILYQAHKWLGRLRFIGRRRPLQIREVVQNAEEHLRSRLLPSIDTAYLPSSMSLCFSEEDWKHLRPFAEHLQGKLREVFRRLAGEPGIRAMDPVFEVKFLRSRRLKEGDIPLMTPHFGDGVREAVWDGPAPRSLDGEADAVEAEEAVPRAEDGGRQPEPGVLELLSTAQRKDGTARQTKSWIYFGPSRPEGLDLEACSAPGPSFEAELDDHKIDLGSEQTIFFADIGGARFFWVPEGVFLIGRDENRCHLVPDDSPANLSGSHLALIRYGCEPLPRVVDLGSTNGTRCEGRSLSPGYADPSQLPILIDIGSEQSLRFEIRPCGSIEKFQQDVILKGESDEEKSVA